MTRATKWGIAALLVAGCSSSPEVPAELRLKAEKSVRGEVSAPVQLSFGDPWFLLDDEQSQMVCGEFEGLPRLADEPVRFIYSEKPDRAVVYPHGGWIGLDRLGDAILAQTRAAFDDAWANGCEDSRPGWHWPTL